MPFRIKSRLAEISKTQVDLIRELEKLGLTVAPSELSNFVTAIRKTPKAEKTLLECDKIIKNWEKEQKK